MNKKTGIYVFGILLLLNIIVYICGGKNALNYCAMGLSAFSLGCFISQEDSHGE